MGSCVENLMGSCVGNLMGSCVGNLELVSKFLLGPNDTNF